MLFLPDLFKLFVIQRNIYVTNRVRYHVPMNLK